MRTLHTVGEGNFVPLKHYDPAEEDKLLNKYCPKIAKEKQKKSGGKGKKGTKCKGKSTPSDDPQPAGTPGSDPQPSPAKKRSPTRHLKSLMGVTNSHLQRVPTDVALEEVG